MVKCIEGEEESNRKLKALNLSQTSQGDTLRSFCAADDIVNRWWERLDCQFLYAHYNWDGGDLVGTYSGLSSQRIFPSQAQNFLLFWKRPADLAIIPQVNLQKVKRAYFADPLWVASMLISPRREGNQLLLLLFKTAQHWQQTQLSHNVEVECLRTSKSFNYLEPSPKILIGLLPWLATQPWSPICLEREAET